MQRIYLYTYMKIMKKIFIINNKQIIKITHYNIIFNVNWMNSFVIII